MGKINKKIKTFARQLEARQALIAKQRDALRDEIAEAQMLSDSLDESIEEIAEAVASLDRAADKLSETQ